MSILIQKTPDELFGFSGDRMRENRVVNLPTGLLEVKVEKSSYNLDELIGFAARANTKRGFLFLSKVLGKHWPVTPKTMQKIHVELASQIPINLSAPLVFIAMAETAIGLGQGVFEAYQEKYPNSTTLFLHTSRYHVGDAKIIEFEEAHSHAPRQFLHLPTDPALQNIFLTARTLVLIDDEVSTGNTFLGLTEVCRQLNPTLNHVHLTTITNLMGKEANEVLAHRFGMPVSSGAILNGEYNFTPNEFQPAEKVAQLFQSNIDRGASTAFGRLGLDRSLTLPVTFVQQLIATIHPKDKVLVLGTGEFMHMAYLLGMALEEQGLDVKVQSTTRSPILEWGAVSHSIAFPDNYGEGVENFIYNVKAAQYDPVFICHETPPNAALFQLAKTLNGRLLHFLSEKEIEEIPVR